MAVQTHRQVFTWDVEVEQHPSTLLPETLFPKQFHKGNRFGDFFLSRVTLAIYRKPGTVSQPQLTHFVSQSSHGKKDPFTVPLFVGMSFSSQRGQGPGQVPVCQRLRIAPPCT